MSAVLRPGARFALRHPAHFIAMGFGSGLVPRGPGTAGTLAGWAIGWLFLRHFPPLALLASTLSPTREHIGQVVLRVLFGAEWDFGHWTELFRFQ